MDKSELISFRLLKESDLPLMHKWLNNGYANKWYGKSEFSLEEVKAKYLPYIKQEKQTYAYIILYDNNPIGYIQTYYIKSYPLYAKQIGVTENAAGLDLFIGDENYIHKGLGKYIISKFLKTIIFNILDVESCIIGPEPDNIVAIKVYEKVGFKFLKLVKTDDGKEYLMKIQKNEINN